MEPEHPALPGSAPRRPSSKSAAEVVAALSGVRAPGGSDESGSWRRRSHILLAGVPLGMALKEGTVKPRTCGSGKARQHGLTAMKGVRRRPALRVFAEGLMEDDYEAGCRSLSGAKEAGDGGTGERGCGQVKTAGEARQKLGVGAAVEGSIEGQGDHLRLLPRSIRSQCENVSAHRGSISVGSRPQMNRP